MDENPTVMKLKAKYTEAKQVKRIKKMKSGGIGGTPRRYHLPKPKLRTIHA